MSKKVGGRPLAGWSTQLQNRYNTGSLSRATPSWPDFSKTKNKKKPKGQTPRDLAKELAAFNARHPAPERDDEPRPTTSHRDETSLPKRGAHGSDAIEAPLVGSAPLKQRTLKALASIGSLIWSRCKKCGDQCEFSLDKLVEQRPHLAGRALDSLPTEFNCSKCHGGSCWIGLIIEGDVVETLDN
jgi:hypothetical protein